jgi:hypothetical protein
MEPIMIDDSRLPSTGSYGPTLAAEMSNISQYKITRHSAYSWAQSLRFLVYDDADDTDEERASAARVSEQRDSDDEESELQRAIALSLSQGDGPSVHEDDDDLDHGNQEGTTNSLLPNANAAEQPSHSLEFSEQKVDAKAFDSDNEEEMTDFAIALSLAEEGDDQNISDMHSLSQPGPSRFDDKHVNEATGKATEQYVCDHCRPFPVFPHHKKARSFRIVRDRPCGHYVAVSYCWPKDENGNRIDYDTTCRIRTTDGHGAQIERRNRAPDDIIDRAVEFARSQGIRMIWVDQECLPQDGSREQELGIQAMDMVYQRASVSVGLFDSVVRDQRHLDAVASVFYRGMHDGKLLYREPDLSYSTITRDLIAFLELIGNDQWNTRAWILQESLAASERMMILIKTESSIQFNAPERVLEYPQIGPGTFNLILNDIQRLIKISKKFLLSYQALGVQVMGRPSPHEERAASILAMLERLHPTAAHFASVTNVVHVKGGTNYGGRKTCNAAVALTFLRTRHNSRPADRLAIVANICDYEVRLNTVEVEKHFQSLGTCLFTLAVINGDLSLLNPDAYQSLSVQGEYPLFALYIVFYPNTLKTYLASQLRSNVLRGHHHLRPCFLPSMPIASDLAL